MDGTSIEEHFNSFRLLRCSRNNGRLSVLHLRCCGLSMTQQPTREWLLRFEWRTSYKNQPWWDWIRNGGRGRWHWPGAKARDSKRRTTRKIQTILNVQAFTEWLIELVRKNGWMKSPDQESRCLTPICWLYLRTSWPASDKALTWRNSIRANVPHLCTAGGSQS